MPCGRYTGTGAGRILLNDFEKQYIKRLKGDERGFNERCSDLHYKLGSFLQRENPHELVAINVLPNLFISVLDVWRKSAKKAAISGLPKFMSDNPDAKLVGLSVITIITEARIHCGIDCARMVRDELTRMIDEEESLRNKH